MPCDLKSSYRGASFVSYPHSRCFTQSEMAVVRWQAMGSVGLAFRCLIQGGGVPGPGVLKTAVPLMLAQTLWESLRGDDGDSCQDCNLSCAILSM